MTSFSEFEFSWDAEKARTISPSMESLSPYAIQDQLAAKADAKGVDLSDLVNDLLKKELEKGKL